mgnify:CR=1 FL=1
MVDLRCHTLHYFYKVIDTDLFDGGDGFIDYKLHKATRIPDLVEDNEIGLRARVNFAKLLKVSVDKIIRIDRDEYYANVDDGDEN